MQHIVEKCKELVELISQEQLGMVHKITEDGGRDTQLYRLSEILKRNLNDYVKVINREE